VSHMVKSSRGNMPSDRENDTNQPILVIVRRGRRGRGFTVAPADDATNVEPCQDESELGEAIREMLDDPNQPRFDPSALGDEEDDEPPRRRSRNRVQVRDDSDDEDEDEDEQPRGGLIDDLMTGVGDNGRDPTDQLIMNIGSRLLRAGQNMSTSGKARRKRSRKNG